MLHEATIYVLGRSATRFASQRMKLESIYPGCNIVFIEVEISLLGEVDAACERIVGAERKVDYFYMSPGLIPLNGPEYTKEGLEICFALSYYTRMRLVSNLLPLLSQSQHPRVLSVLNGGKEKAIYDNDIGLAKNWSPIAVINHTTTMTTLSSSTSQKTTSKSPSCMHSPAGSKRTSLPG